MMPPPISIFMYHNISAAVPEDRKPKLYVNTRSFKLQMALLNLFGYKGLSVGQALPYLSGEKRGKVFVITFDDGYADTANLALPILQRYKFTATCYVVSQRLGQYNTWDAQHIGAEKPLMNQAELKKWCEAGMEIGAHTQTHPHLTKCNEEDLKSEIINSKNDLESLIKTPVTQFCYPYGSYNSRVAEVVKAAGYTTATTTNKGVTEIGSNLFTLPRERPKLLNVLKLLFNLR